MKKVLFGILAAVLVLSVCVTTALAAGRGRDDAGAGGAYDDCGTCVHADADGDGVCDACGAKHGSCQTGKKTAFVDADDDGVCDNRSACPRYTAAGVGRFREFVDADGDGVCDNYGTCQGTGNGRGNCAQDGCGNYVDADGSGTCGDHHTSGHGRGGHGCGHRNARGR